MKVRLKDIAEATGFSINTISHALRDEPDISQATKEKIRAVAKELEYIPNLQASSIKSGRRRIISIILPDIINPHFTIVFREIERFFRDIGVTPFFMNTNENPDDEINAVQLSIGQNVDGVIICPTQANSECVRILKKSKIPFVLIGRRFDEPIDTDYVVCDDAEGARIATEHLIQLGHREIAYFRFNDIISSDRERWQGYSSALANAGIDENHRPVLNMSLSGEDNRSAVREFIKSHPECTAILSFSDILACAVIRDIQSMGLRVPQDISVVGFDNICSDYALPTGITSVSVSKKHMANIASELLNERINANDDGSSPRRHIVLPTKLFLRETTCEVALNK